MKQTRNCDWITPPLTSCTIQSGAFCFTIIIVERLNFNRCSPLKGPFNENLYSTFCLWLYISVWRDKLTLFARSSVWITRNSNANSNVLTGLVLTNSKGKWKFVRRQYLGCKTIFRKPTKWAKNCTLQMQFC